MCLKILFGDGGYRNSVLLTTSSPDAHAHARTHTNTVKNYWNFQKQPVASIKPSLPSQSSPDRQIGKHGVISFGKKGPPFSIPRCNSTQRGRQFIRWEIETESNNTSLCERQNEAPISYLSLFTRQRQKKRWNRRREGKTKKKKKEKKTLYWNHCKALRSFSLIRTDLSGWRLVPCQVSRKGQRGQL